MKYKSRNVISACRTIVEFIVLKISNFYYYVLEISNALETYELQVYTTKVKTFRMSSTILCLRVLIKMWIKLGTSSIYRPIVL